jgi:transposase
MPKTHQPYPPEFRQQILELVRADRSPDELAAEFEPTAQTIRNWIKQDEREHGQRQDGLSSEEKAELARLRKENKQLRLEREILSKAAAWFARETEAVPPKSSNL